MKTNQSEIAEKAGISRSFFSLILQGKRNAPYLTALKLAEQTDSNPAIWHLGGGTPKQRQAAVAAYKSKIQKL